MSVGRVNKRTLGHVRHGFLDLLIQLDTGFAYLDNAFIAIFCSLTKDVECAKVPELCQRDIVLAGRLTLTRT